MKILRAYADAGAMGGQNFGPGTASDENREKRQPAEQVKKSGDRVRFSAEALELLKGEAQENLNVCANDATYDQYGNITRQVDALRRDLSNLARTTYASAPAIAGKINSLSAQTRLLRAQV